MVLAMPWTHGKQKTEIQTTRFPRQYWLWLSWGDWPIYKEIILTFARRNRDIRVDIVELYRVEDSESDSSDPSDWTDQERTPDPDNDEQDHDEEQDSDDEVDDENNREGNHNGR